MNILYITHLSGNRSAGLTYSIPAQIFSQSKIDNVYWVNDSLKIRNSLEHSEIMNVLNFPRFRICELPKPFNKPDIVIFESFYKPTDYMISKLLLKENIPYIIVPRGALTENAQNKRKFKKKLGNLILFSSFAKKAAAIHYLTDKEYRDSGKKWNNRHFIVPNGSEEKLLTRKYSNGESLKGVFIGRLDIYHKGIDLLIQSCKNNMKLMIDNNCTVDIYGPKTNDLVRIKELISELMLDDVVFLKDPVFGQKKENILLECDYFVLTSRFEGHPMGLIEAISFGLPCLVSTGTNMAEEISNENAGWVCDTDVYSITEAIAKLINEKDCLKQKGENALKLSRKYKWEIIAEKTHHELERLLLNLS